MTSRTWILVGSLGVGLLFLCICAALTMTLVPRLVGLEGLSFFPRFQARASETVRAELQVPAPVSLTVIGSVGEVTVRAGNEKRIEVQATKTVRAITPGRARELLARIRVNAESTGHQARVQVEIPNTRDFRTASVDLVITVPRRIRLDIQTRVGEIDVGGVEGSVRLRSEVGDVRLRRVVLTGDSEVKADVGDVRFAGRLPRQGRVQFTTQVGEIRIELPADSQFILDATANVGDVESEFELAERESEPVGAVGRKLRGRVGAEPGVTLVLRTQTGDIEVKVQ